MVTLQEQALYITTQLNDVAQELTTYTEDNKYDIQFLAVDTLQSINKHKQMDGRKYIPIILTRVEPDIPFTQYGMTTDYLYLSLYFDAPDRGIVEEIVEAYRQANTSKNIVIDDNQITQYIGKLVTQEVERPQDGTVIRKLSASLRVNWVIQGAGIISNSIKIKINGEIVNAKIATYRNDKASAPTKPYTDGLDSRYMVSEQLALTIPLTAEFQTTQLWRDINTQSYNKIYDVEINYGISTNTKTMRLLTGIINIEEGRIASATVIFDNPLPRAELEIKYSNKETDEFLDGTVHLTTFGFSGDTAIDGRLQDKSTKGEPLRRTVGINFSFIFEKDNEMSTNLVNQIFYRDINARYNITVKMEGYEIILENLVMEKGEHSFSENPGVSFSVVFVEGVTASGE